MTLDKFIEQLEEVFERDNGSMISTDAFRDYDEWDSITLLTLIAMLEDEYSVTIPRARFEAMLTIQDMFDIVKELHK
jgi:acyl carrier protein